MKTSHPRGFVLLVVLGAAAVLSLIAAFIYTRTENQLLLSVSARGQSIAAARATLAAERTLALYRTPFGYPTAINGLAIVNSYADAIATPNAVLWTPAENYGIPGLDISNGSGAQWCVEVWRLNRGLTVPPWTVIEAFGYYGETNPKAVGTAPGQGFTQPGCLWQGTNRMIWSHITVHLEVPPSSGSGGTNTPAGPAGGTSAVGAG